MFCLPKLALLFLPVDKIFLFARHSKFQDSYEEHDDCISKLLLHMTTNANFKGIVLHYKFLLQAVGVDHA